MKCVILCAGYATRLYPLTLNTPKALLPVKGKPILDYIIKKIPSNIDDIIIVSNDKFYPCFVKWAAKYGSKVKVLNDRTKDNETRLGGIGDLRFAIEQANIEDDVLVILGDNLFDFELNEFISEFSKLKETFVGVCDLYGEDLSKYGVVSVKENKISSFEEKPENPKSSLAAIGIYAYTKEDLKEIKDYMNKGLPKDGPGLLVKYLSDKKDVHAFVFNGKWFDIGNKEIYAKVNNNF